MALKDIGNGSLLNLNYSSSDELAAYLSSKEPGDTITMEVTWQMTENDAVNSTATGPITEISIPESEEDDPDERRPDSGQKPLMLVISAA